MSHFYRDFYSSGNLFGAELENVINKECDSVSSSVQSLLKEIPLAISVPVIVRRCVEETEKRGLEIVGKPIFN